MKRLLLGILLCALVAGCRTTDAPAPTPLKTEGEYLHEGILRMAENVGKRLGESDPLFKALLELADYAYKHAERCSDIAARWKLLEEKMNARLSGN